MNPLSQFGWDESRRQQLPDELLPARVAIAERGRYWLVGERQGWATCAGRLLDRTSRRANLPAVGDFVGVRAGGDNDAMVIDEVLPRTSCFVRKAAGTSSAAQVICTNVDRVLIVTACGPDLSARRIERYVAAVWAAGATPVVVVNKIDLHDGDTDIAGELAEATAGVEQLLLSAHSGDGLAALDTICEPGKTIALVGSSGVGKSTLVNYLLGTEELATGDIRDGDGKGRHTTTHRELVVTPSGAIVIDTPGMREFGLVGASDGLDEAFADVEAAAQSCRFRDCDHGGEPGCGVAAAVDAGELSPERVASYQQLAREIAYEDRRNDRRAAEQERGKWKSITKSMRVRRKINRKLGLKDW